MRVWRCRLCQWLPRSSTGLSRTRRRCQITGRGANRTRGAVGARWSNSGGVTTPLLVVVVVLPAFFIVQDGAMTNQSASETNIFNGKVDGNPQDGAEESKIDLEAATEPKSTFVAFHIVLRSLCHATCQNLVQGACLRLKN